MNFCEHINKYSVVQLKDINERKEEILKRVTHIIDIDGWRISERYLYAEVSIFSVRDMICHTYYVYHPGVFLSDHDFSSVSYVSNRIHGLPFLRKKYSYSDITQHEFHNIFKRNFSDDTFVFAFKGGHIEKDLCSYYSLECINLELFGCAKYEKQLQIFEMKSKSCFRHGKSSRGLPFHCSRFEVYCFTLFVFNELQRVDKFEKVKGLYIQGA